MASVWKMRVHERPCNLQSEAVVLTQGAVVLFQ